MSATVPNIGRAASDAEAYLGDMGLADDVFAIMLAYREALCNAVLHGSNEDPGLLVTSTLCLDGEDIRVVVTDQGPGFDWQGRSLDPPAPERTSGRGISIMNQYFPHLCYNQSGNSLELRKPVRGNAMSDVQQDGTRAVIRPDGDIVISASETLRGELKRLIDSGVEDLTVDFGGVSMVDSIGIGLLIAAHNSLSSKGARLKIANADKEILGLLETMRLNKHFEILE